MSCRDELMAQVAPRKVNISWVLGSIPRNCQIYFMLFQVIRTKSWWMRSAPASFVLCNWIILTMAVTSEAIFWQLVFIRTQKLKTERHLKARLAAAGMDLSLRPCLWA